MKQHSILVPKEKLLPQIRSSLEENVKKEIEESGQKVRINIDDLKWTKDGIIVKFTQK